MITQSVTHNESNNKNRVITFHYESEDDPFCTSIIIDGSKLTNLSTMKDLMLFKDSGDESVNEEHFLRLDYEDGPQLYFQIVVQNGKRIMLKKNRFLNTTVDDLYNLDGVVSPLPIIIIPK